MTPAYTGVITGHSDGDPAEISVTGATFDRTTKVRVKSAIDEINAVTADITLNEEGRRELIELLGGTP
jgi:hypothetical protein